MKKTAFIFAFFIFATSFCSFAKTTANATSKPISSISSSKAHISISLTYDQLMNLGESGLEKIIDSHFKTNPVCTTTVTVSGEISYMGAKFTLTVSVTDSCANAARIARQIFGQVKEYFM